MIVEPEASNSIWREKDVVLYFVREICIGGAFFSRIVQNPARVVAW